MSGGSGGDVAVDLWARVPGIVGTLGVFVPVVLSVGRSFRERAGVFFARPSHLWILPVTLSLYCWSFMWVGGQRDADPYAEIAAYFAVPTLLLYLRGRASSSADLLDLLLVLSLWLPVESRTVLRAIHIEGGRYPIAVLCALLFGLIAFTAWRRVELNCEWSIRREHLRTAAFAFAILAALIVPPGLATGFLAPNVNDALQEQPWLWALAPLAFAGIFFSPALAEEFIFRGLVQNLLQTRMRWLWAWAVSSAVFGLAHLNNKVADFGRPNWTYAGFAAVAGLAYGYVYHRTRSLVAAALLHATVDFVWLLFFKA